MNKFNQKGFAFFELILVMVIVAAVAMVGVRVMGHKGTNASNETSSSLTEKSKITSKAISIPEIVNKADLDKADTALDQNDNSADDNHDSGTLDAHEEEL